MNKQKDTYQTVAYKYYHNFTFKYWSFTFKPPAQKCDTSSYPLCLTQFQWLVFSIIAFSFLNYSFLT